MSVPGMIYPTMKGMPAGNPRDSAIANMNNASVIQAQANNAVGGRKQMHSRRGGAGAITVPQYQMSYEPQGGPGTNPNDQIAINAQVSTQGAANSALDAGAFKMGGRRSQKRRGGNPDWIWGCMSGGRTKCSSRRRSSKKRSSRKRSSKKKSSRKRY